MKARRDAARASAAEVADAATSARIAEQGNRVLARESSEEEMPHEGLLNATKERQLDERETFREIRPAKEGSSAKSIADARWPLNWEIVDGEKCEGSPVREGLSGPGFEGWSSRGPPVCQPSLSSPSEDLPGRSAQMGHL